MTDYWIGVDTGGTFTDLVLVDRDANHRVSFKLPTTPDDPALGILSGVRSILDLAEADGVDVSFLGHGTTLGTNAILTGRTAPTGMITTQGFRDILELGRQRRPSFYDIEVAKPTPPATRDHIIEVAERLDECGGVVMPLDEDGVRDAARQLQADGVTAVAICFMHAYANPDHEARAAAIVREVWPDAFVCASSDILREFREFERFATTTVNASLLPVMDEYLRRFEAGLAELGVSVPPLVMQSNGGAVSPATVRAAPVNTFFSGPAGGVIATVALGKSLAMENLVSFDMGGTSTDVCLVKDGAPAKRNVRDMAGFPVRIPTLDLHTIGAGGGSIAWADPGGLLKVGPHSAGATPGPALYGLGGEDATVTDANVVLGRLSGGALIGGAMTVYPEKSYEAVARLGEKIELDPIATAAGIIEIVNVNMMGAVRAVSIEKGEDPRHYALVAFGGAGPLHAAGVAAEMGMDTVVIPTRPGILSALGLLDADVRGDFSITRLVALTLENTAALRDGAVDLMARGAAWRVAERLNEDSVEISWTADLRYIGQAFELMAPILTLSGTPDFDEATLAALRAEFHRQHASINGYAMEGHAVEMVNLRLSVAAIRPSAGGVEILGDGADVEETIRPVWFPETGFVETPVRDRASLTPDQRIAGPMIVEQMDTTLVIPPAATAIVQPSGDLTLHLGGTQT